MAGLARAAAVATAPVATARAEAAHQTDEVQAFEWAMGANSDESTSCEGMTAKVAGEGMTAKVAKRSQPSCNPLSNEVSCQRSSGWASPLQWGQVRHRHRGEAARVAPAAAPQAAQPRSGREATPADRWRLSDRSRPCRPRVWGIRSRLSSRSGAACAGSPRLRSAGNCCASATLHLRGWGSCQCRAARDRALRWSG